MKKTVKKNKKVIPLNLPKVVRQEENFIRLAKKMNKKVSTIFALAIIVVVVVFFVGWAWRLDRQIKQEALSATVSVSREGNLKEDGVLPKKQVTGSDNIVYANKEFGFELDLPRDGKKFAVKEISPKGMNVSVAFGLPFIDSEIKKVKKEGYSEIFRIELVPVADLGQKICADKSRQFPLCDNDDQELGRNSQYVFVYTRYDKLDAVQKSKTKLIPDDFDASVFSEADQISKSFRLVAMQTGEGDRKL